MLSQPTFIQKQKEPLYRPSYFPKFTPQEYLNMKNTEYMEYGGVESPQPLMQTNMVLHQEFAEHYGQPDEASPAPLMMVQWEELPVIVSNSPKHAFCYEEERRDGLQDSMRMSQPSDQERIDDFYATYCCCPPPGKVTRSKPIKSDLKSMTFENIKLLKKMQRGFPGILEEATHSFRQSLASTSDDDEIIVHAKTKTQKNASKINFRGSKFIGVSKNGESWQVYIVINKRKKYVGCFETKLEAASIYDKLALNFHGLKAKTNFSYTKKELLNIITRI